VKLIFFLAVQTSLWKYEVIIFGTMTTVTTIFLVACIIIIIIF